MSIEQAARIAYTRNGLQKREARKKLEDRLRPINQGLYRPLSVMRFRDYAEGDWSVLCIADWGFRRSRSVIPK
jgi:hypothetical protein